MDWEPEQLNLGALGFAGICRETYRVLIRAVLPTNQVLGVAILSAFLLAQIATDHALHSSDLVFGMLAIAYVFSKTVCMIFIFLLSIMFTAIFVLRVATLYCTDGDSGASDRILRDLPCVPLLRLVFIFITVLPLANFYITLSALAWFELPKLDPSEKVVVLALQLLGGAVLLAGAAYVVVVSHIVCVVALLEELEEDFCFGTMRKSRALLAGKFWPVAAVFFLLDGCFVALQRYFPYLVFDDALGLGRAFQVAAGVAMAVALWAVVVVTLVAQPVVYLVCKNYHNEVVDKVHLNYVGEYQRLDVDVDGDRGVELQEVKTEEQIPETPAGQSPPGSST